LAYVEHKPNLIKTRHEGVIAGTPALNFY